MGTESYTKESVYGLIASLFVIHLVLIMLLLS